MTGVAFSPEGITPGYLEQLAANFAAPHTLQTYRSEGGDLDGTRRHRSGGAHAAGAGDSRRRRSSRAGRRRPHAGRACAERAPVGHSTGGPHVAAHPSQPARRSPRRVRRRPLSAGAVDFAGAFPRWQPHVLRPRRSPAPTRQPHHAQSSRAHERDVVRHRRAALRGARARSAVDNDTWAVVLTGAGRGFCSGLDLEDHGMPPDCDGLPMSRIAIRAMEFMSNIVPAMRAVPQPIIAAVNGAAYGGGMCLMLRRRHPPRRRVGALPQRRHHQRPHRDRARRELAPAAPGRRRARVGRHPQRPRGGRRRGRADRHGVARLSRRRAARRRRSSSPSRSAAGARTASR